MDELNLLTKALMALDDKLAACMKCGLCQAVCPVYGATLMEADVTRGKIALLENLARRMIDDPDAVSDKLDRCLLCGSCQANCPSGVSILEIFMEARAIVAEYKGLSPLKKALFRTLLPNPRLFAALMRVTSPLRSCFLRQEENVQNTCRAPLPFFGDRHMPPLAATPLSAKVGRMNTPKGKSRLKVAFFPGCLGDKVYTDMSEACLKVFDHHEVGVYLPDNFACCGIPALASGDMDGFARMVRHNVNVFKEGSFDYIVTPCSSCTATIRDLWPQICAKTALPYRYRDATNELSLKTMDINAFLVDVLKVRPRSKGHPRGKTKVTYHESCHLRTSLGVSQQPRTLIRMNAECELVEMAEADRCCGCGGSFTLTQPELSRRIGQRKRDNVIASGADVVATGCPACMMQLADVLAANNDSVAVKHVIELYADSLK